MSTIEEFENAPVGATASSVETNTRYVKNSDDRWLLFDGTGHLLVDEYHLHYEDFTLDPLDPSAPTTAREALDLAWELAHPVREGQEVQVGTELIARFEDGDFRTYRAKKPFEGTSEPGWAETRTLDPLPDPVPDWLDAPAVMAHAEDEEPHVWVNIDARGWRDEHGNTRQWTALRDVTPLYPKEDA